MVDYNKNVIAVSNSSLFHDDSELFDGFMSAGKIDFADRIISNHKSVFRPSTFDPDSKYFKSFKKIATCCFVVNPQSRTISSYNLVPTNGFTTRKGLNDNCDDSKDLRGVWSCGYVRNLDSLDIIAENIAENPLKPNDPIASNMLENLKKDIFVEGGAIDSKNLHFLGYINNNANEISKGYFWMVYVLPTNASMVGKKDARQSRMISFNDLTRLVDSNARLSHDLATDFWTSMSYQPMKEYLTDRYSDLF
ncbi:MAG: hypothetical protein ACP5NW_03575 [Candidatus Woesearchaeota archaeon]